MYNNGIIVIAIIFIIGLHAGAECAGEGSGSRPVQREDWLRCDS